MKTQKDMLEQFQKEKEEIKQQEEEKLAELQTNWFQVQAELRQKEALVSEIKRKNEQEKQDMSAKLEEEAKNKIEVEKYEALLAQHEELQRKLQEQEAQKQELIDQKQKEL